MKYALLWMTCEPGCGNEYGELHHVAFMLQSFSRVPSAQVEARSAPQLEQQHHGRRPGGAREAARGLPGPPHQLQRDGHR